MESYEQDGGILSNVSIYFVMFIVSSSYVQIKNSKLFNGMRPYSYIVSPLLFIIPLFMLNLVIYFYASYDPNLYVLSQQNDFDDLLSLKSFITLVASEIVISNVPSINSLLIDIMGFVHCLFNCSSFIQIYEIGQYISYFYAFALTYIIIILIPWSYVYLICKSYRPNLLELVPGVNDVVKNSMTFAVILIIYATVESEYPDFASIVCYILFSMWYIDSILFNKLNKIYELIDL